VHIAIFTICYVVQKAKRTIRNLLQIVTMSVAAELKRITTATLQKMKGSSKKISMLTAYDFSFARIIDESGIDVILVGDSASNVMAGHETTLPITLDHMIYHASSVIRGAKRCLVVVDLPFGSYQSNSDIALASAIRIMKETGAHAIKLEGGEEVLDSVKRIISAGIPVMAHLGLTPQSIYKFGSYNVRAKEDTEAKKLKLDAKLMEQAGCFALVLEKIPALLAKEVSESLTIPTIGIGAGKYCDGQVLVMHDMLGINTEFKPRFLRQYLNITEQATKAVKQYIADVKSGGFPTDAESY
jgi:3-methyl-2-oxobutanoate hydroxymethyltransferase